MKKLGALSVLSFGCAILPYIYLIPVYLLSRTMAYGGGSLAFYFLALPMFMFIFVEAAALGISTACIIQQTTSTWLFCSSTFFCLFDRKHFDYCLPCCLPEIAVLRPLNKSNIRFSSDIPLL